MYRILLSAAIISIAVLGCSSPTPPQAIYNEAASIHSADTLAENPLQWQVVTSFINRNDKSMSTLYGNDTAVAYARHHADGHYSSHAKLALVTWQQQPDKHWFGGNIPGNILSVEMVTFDAAGTPQYTAYEGKPLHKRLQQTPDRLAMILSCRAAVVPGE